MKPDIARFPLTWPETMPRTATLGASQFKTTLARALDNVQSSLKRFAADSGKALDNIVISSNVTLGAENPKDPGVAVWFSWDNMQLCIAVDRYKTVADNLQAIHHIIEARRTELRHGTLALVRASFTGFRALPAPPGRKTWRDVLGIKIGDQVSVAIINREWRSRVQKAHPDSGGSNEQIVELNAAKDAALRELADS